MSDYAARAARGAAWLDEVIPGWWQRINLNHLNMAAARYVPAEPYPCGCVCSQLDLQDARAMGRYGRFLLDHGIDDRDEVEDYGFDLMGADVTGDYDPLTAAWRAEIEKRRAG